MKNTNIIKFKLPYRAAASDVEDKKEQLAVGRERVEALMASLRALGCEAAAMPTKTGAAAEVTIVYPTVADARKATKRGGRKMCIELPDNSPIKGKTVEEAVAWMNGHTARENAKALGCSVSQYFRRKKYFERMPEDHPIEAIWSTK